MNTHLITRKDNTLLKLMRLIGSQARRAPHEMVLSEGVRTIEEALAAGCETEAVVFAENFGKTEREGALLEACIRSGAKIYQAGQSAIRSVSDVVTPQGVIAIIRVPVRRLEELESCDNPLILCACGIQDPGNLGTLIRTAAAAGASLVCTLGGTVSARNPKSIRSSAGAFFRIPIVEGISAVEFLSHCACHSIRAYRTSARGGQLYFMANFIQPSAILLGNEGRGISQIGLESLPSVRIPMMSGAESLNVASAGAVLLLEAHRQRMPIQQAP